MIPRATSIGSLLFALSACSGASESAVPPTTPSETSTIASTSSTTQPTTTTTVAITTTNSLPPTTLATRRPHWCEIKASRGRPDEYGNATTNFTLRTSEAGDTFSVMVKYADGPQAGITGTPTDAKGYASGTVNSGEGARQGPATITATDVGNGFDFGVSCSSRFTP